jgi:predicted PurR-regulated permease PerM
MNETQRDILSAGFSLMLIVLAAFVMHRFFLPLVWAGILCVATWPLYACCARMGGRDVLAAAVLTLLMLAVFGGPLALGVTQAARQAPELAALSSRPTRMAARAGLYAEPAHGGRLDCGLVVRHAEPAARIGPSVIRA